MEEGFEKGLKEDLKNKLKEVGWELLDEPNYDTSAIGWDLIMRGEERILAIETKYFLGQKLPSMVSLMAAMLANRKKFVREQEITERAWAFNLDRFRCKKDRGKIKSYIPYEFGIYFCEQISRKETRDYWKVFLNAIDSIFFIDDKNKISYEVEPKNLLRLSDKFIGECEKKELPKYLKGNKSQKQKPILFKERILSHLKKI